MNRLPSATRGPAGRSGSTAIVPPGGGTVSPTRSATTLGPRSSFALIVLSLAATLPLALSTAGRASAGGLVVAPERAALLDALHGPELMAVRSADPTGESAERAVDGRDETVWTGRAGETQWRWTAAFVRPTHVGLIRAHFGQSATSGVPTAFRWEVRRGSSSDGACPNGGAEDADVDADVYRWVAIPGAARLPAASGDALAQPTRQSWFVGGDACGLRLVVDRTNAGPPVLREVQAIESARDVLVGAKASDDGASSGFAAEGAIDDAYATRWAGAPGKGRWILRVDLQDPQPIDRIRLVLGFDATSVPRPGGGPSNSITLNCPVPSLSNVFSATDAFAISFASITQSFITATGILFISR